MPMIINDTDATPATVAPATTAPPTVIQMSSDDLQSAVGAILTQMAPAAQSGQGGPVLVQISADQLKQAVRDSIADLQKDAVASSKMRHCQFADLAGQGGWRLAPLAEIRRPSPKLSASLRQSKVWPTAKS